MFYIMSNPDTNSDAASNERHIGRVKWFNNQKGYGFLTFKTTTGDWEDVFVHHSALMGDESDSFRYLVQDEYVEFVRVVSSDALATASDVSGPLQNKLAYQLRNERRMEAMKTDDAEGKESRGKSRYRGGGPRQGRLQVSGTQWKIPKGNAKDKAANTASSSKEEAEDNKQTE